ncbi:MAG TPA: phosphoribosyltransferase family protein [Chitinophagaceae bacterium]|jgi:predicted phosphoribosyltransferase|nr:phosphoribosyltransferase family protein [Chitinophagaceae bacterium]
MFRNREDAGAALAAKLVKYKGSGGLILAVPRGGIPVAYAVAKRLSLPVEIVLTKKIGHPLNKEYAIGAASLNDYFVVPHEMVTDEYIVNEVEKIRSRLKQMYKQYMGDKQPCDVAGQTVIVIDDGMATGNTLMATINVLRKGKPAKIVVAVPVASQSAVSRLNGQVNEVIAALVPQHFEGVGAYYENFEQVTDEEAQAYLRKLNQINQLA